MYEVNPQQLVHMAQPLDTCGTELSRLANRVRNSSSTPFMGSNEYGRIVQSTIRAARELDMKANQLHDFASAIRAIAALYSSAEHGVINQIRSKPTVQAAEKRADGGQASSQSGTSQDSSKRDESKDLLHLAKYIKEAGLDDTTKDSANILAKLISYFDSFGKMFDKEHWADNGLKELLDLCKDSGGFWKGAYDYLLNFYKMKGFNGSGIFSIAGQKGVLGIGIGTSVLGLVSTLMELPNKSFNSDLDRVNAYITEVGRDAADVGKSVYDVKSLMTLINSGGTVKATGGLTATALVNGAIAIVTQSASSWNNYYMKDRNLTLHEAGLMMEEIGVSALYYMFGGTVLEPLTGVSGEELAHTYIRVLERLVYGE